MTHDRMRDRPTQHAHAAENLLPHLRPGARVLDVGSGSGFLAAVLYHLTAPGGKVVGIEHIPELADWSRANLRADGLAPALDADSLVVLAGDGRAGAPQHAPFDAIHVGAAAPTIPRALVEQLACPGRMFIPVGPEGGSQAVVQVDKDEKGEVTEKELFGVMVGADCASVREQVLTGMVVRAVDGQAETEAGLLGKFSGPYYVFAALCNVQTTVSSQKVFARIGSNGK
jgi:protein-L-isoaspartate(D-aspartate) O-methyltransferase